MRPRRRERETGACRSPRGVDDRHAGNLRIILCEGSVGDFASSANNHTEICRFIETVPKFKYYDNYVVILKITDLIKQNCDSLEGE